MRQDLDQLMRHRGVAGLVVCAADRYTPAMYYATGERIHFGLYFRAADGRAHLVHDPMERDQAARVDCERSGFPQHRFHELLESEGRPARAHGRLIADVCAQLGIRGPVAFFGDMAAADAHLMIERALEANPQIVLDRGFPDLLAAARATKDADEIAAIRRASNGGVAALEGLRRFLAELEPAGAHFRYDGLAPVRLGDLRRLLHAEFLAHGLEGGECIVAQGRDAGVPHNPGNDDEPVRAGTPLLVDIFPCEAGGGYYTDITRTFCLGAVPDDLRRLYDDVHDAFRLAMDALEVGGECRSYQERVCEFFESRGHGTQRQDFGRQEGYVHGLGHGIGLAVHEAPRLGGPPSNTQRLEPGMVVTIEPGLYYPSRGLGVRIEDSVVVGAGGCECLTPAAYGLEVVRAAS